MAEGEIEYAVDQQEGDVDLPSPIGSRWNRWFGPGSTTLTYIGVISMAAGFALIAVTWGKVAGLLAIPLQLPYVASGGLTSVGLVVLGATLISVSAARRDAHKREARLEELSQILRSISEVSDSDPDDIYRP
jgi:hypothetical protein